MVVTLITSLSLFLLRVREDHPRTSKRPTCQARSTVEESDMLLQHLSSQRLLTNKPSKAPRGEQMTTTLQQTMEHHPRHLRPSGLLSPDLLQTTANEELANW
jgi:hypothetical protein